MRFYDRALKFKPDMAIVWANKGKLMFRLRRFAEALEAFEAGLKRKIARRRPAQRTCASISWAGSKRARRRRGAR